MTEGGGGRRATGTGAGGAYVPGGDARVAGTGRVSVTGHDGTAE